ncbi:esterase family protein, partial [Pseudonocardia sp. N23]|uniref:alpha/beta hydrolase n=1 Tax=Pseudonocardia sp. N23 TaxID=1987376 RepID=UPI000BFB1295
MFGLHASTIRLDNGWFVGIVAVVAVLLVALVPWRWDAWRRRRTWRAVTTLAAVVGVVAATAAGANLLGSFYPTLGSLLGSSGNPGEGTVADIGPDGGDLAAAMPVIAARSADGHGSVLHMVFHGQRSGITRDADVYLPAGYSDPANAAVRYPVVEWLPGFPGEPREVVALFGVTDLVDAAIADHRMPPAIVLVPDINGEPRFGHDEECVDAQRGAADDTYLTTDLHDWARSTLRVRTEREAWALSGWSSGGYCAMNLALRHPDIYSIAISQSGYDRTPDDIVTGDLFAGRPDLLTANDVVAHLRDRPAPTTILATAGADEADEQAALARLRAAAVPPVTLTTHTFPGGGHNQVAVRAQLPPLVDWLGRHLPGPVAPSTLPADAKVVPAPGVAPPALP